MSNFSSANLGVAPPVLLDSFGRTKTQYCGVAPTISSISDSGTIYIVDQSTAFDITLPSISQTSDKMWVKFILLVTGAHTVRVLAPSGTPFYGEIRDTATPANTVITGKSIITYVSGTATVGDVIYAFYDNTTSKIFINAVTGASGGITAA